MPGVAVVGKDSAGGTQLGGGQDFVTIDGDLVVVVGDPVQPHAPSNSPHSSGPVMVQGSSFVTIEGIPVCIAGNSASCGHASTGRPHVTIDG